MAFTFTAQPSEAPIPETELARISWRDTSLSPDAWHVTVLSSNNMTAPSWITNYAAYIHDFTIDASIDAREWVRRFQENLPFYANPDIELTATPAAYNIVQYKFEIRYLSGGTLSAVQGSTIYIPIPDAIQQPWNYTDDFFTYYPVFAYGVGTEYKGWLTSRPVKDVGGTYLIRYDLSPYDYATVNLLQMENYSYVFDSPWNTNSASWDTISVTVETPTGTLTTRDTSFAVPTTWNEANRVVPIGPQNIQDRFNTAPLFSFEQDEWYYYDVVASDAGTQLGATIRVYNDCRPTRHTPAQLYWIGDKGGAEVLRFDARVKDVYDVGTRDVYRQSLNDFFTFDFVQTLPHYVRDYAEGTRSFTLSETFFSDDERELFKTAMTSKHMMVNYEGKWYPCHMKTTNYVHEQTSSKLLPINCEVTVSQPLTC